MSEHLYDWERFWHPVGIAPVLTDDGFMLDPTTEWGKQKNSSQVTQESLALFPCLILLGEPGVGKTREIKKVRVSLETLAHENDDVVIAIDLGSIASESQLYRKLFEHPTFQAWADEKCTKHLYLILDSLDECLLRVTTVARHLLDELRNCPTNRISLRIACRTAIWSGSLGFLEKGLQKLWEQENVAITELSPLRRNDILHAAEKRGIADPDAFIREIIRSEAQAFAIKPVTLDLLLNIYLKRAALPASNAEIYQEGCRLLCAEMNEERQTPDTRGKLSPEQRLAIAGRIAAVTVFANRYAVFTSNNHTELTDADVSIASLAGGLEKDMYGATFSVSEEAIREVLNTGLFTGRGINRMGWAHQTFAEYLAAWYVTTKHPISGKRLLSLLIHPDDTDNKLAPQLYSVAAWIAPHSIEIMRHIAKTDPDILLSGDTVAGMDDEMKAQIIDRLFEMIRDGDVSSRNFASREQQHRLDYPDLHAKLLPPLLDKAGVLEVRRATIGVAEICARRETQEQLARIALDQTEPTALRIEAAYAVARIGDSATRQMMIPLAEGTAGDDPDDELKGCGLLAVWSEHITGAQLISILTPPKREELLGSYASFLYSLNIDGMSDADLITALEWVASYHSPHSYGDHREHVVHKIIARAWERMDTPGVTESLAEMAFIRIQKHEPIFGADRYGRVKPPDMANTEKRRKLLEALFARLESSAQPDDILFDLALQGDGLFRRDDLTWLLQILKNASPGSPEALRFARLINLLFNWCWDAPDDLAAISQATHWSPDLANEYKSLFQPVDLNSDEAQQMRKRHAKESEMRSRAARPLLTPSPEERIRKSLEDFKTGNNLAWVNVCRDLQLEPDSRYYDRDLVPDITSLPGWKAADEALQSQILDAAESYLRRYNPDNLEWIGTDTLNFASAAGYRAFMLLLLQRHNVLFSLPESVWQTWAPVIPAYPLENTGNIWEINKVLVKMAYYAAPDAVTSTLMKLIDKDSAQGHHLTKLKVFSDCLDGRLADALLAKLNEPSISASVTGAILNGLIEYGQGDVPNKALMAAKHLLAELLPHKGMGDSLVDHKAQELAVHLLTTAPDAGWDIVWAAICNDNEFGKEILESVAYRDRRSSHLFTVLSEEQLAELYRWLVENYPHDQDDIPAEAHFISPRESVITWRNNLLHYLVARGTSAACAAMKQLVDEYPALTWLPQMLQETRNATRRNTWQPPMPEQVIRFTSDSEPRLVRSGSELLDVVIESLERLQAKLQGETPAAFDLWSEIPGLPQPSPGNEATEPANTNGETKGKTDKKKTQIPKRYRPKDENTLSDYIKRHLEEDLRDRGVILGREVEIRRKTDGGSSGEVTDIHISAIVPGSRGGESGEYDVVTVIIEVKGAWNSGLDNAMENQLVDRYLRDNNCSHGIYLVGWFKCSQWDSNDDRKTSRNKTIEAMRTRLNQQAVSLSASRGVGIASVVLDISLR